MFRFVEVADYDDYDPAYDNEPYCHEDDVFENGVEEIPLYNPTNDDISGPAIVSFSPGSNSGELMLVNTTAYNDIVVYHWDKKRMCEIGIITSDMLHEGNSQKHLLFRAGLLPVHLHDDTLYIYSERRDNNTGRLWLEIHVRYTGDTSVLINKA